MEHYCNKEADIEVIKAHVEHIKEGFDRLEKKIDKGFNKFATKRELTLHRGFLAGLWAGLIMLFKRVYLG